MGTRGFVTFVIDGTEKTAYNHWDSYPGGLGVDVLNWLRTAVSDIDALRTAAGDLRVVDPNSEPTDADIERLSTFYDGSVGGKSERPTWYQLLRGTQGDPAAMLRAGAIEDASDFPTDSLFAEYGYVVDLDSNVFEAYVGFQHSPHTKGRFAGREGNDDSDGYYPVALAASWPLSDLPDDKTFCEAIEPSEDEED